MIEFNRVTKTYDGDIHAVSDVTFGVNEGEFLFLIGPSGSGKTTLIKMLIRDETPTSGKVFFKDTDITRINRRKVYKLRREVGVIFQDFKLVMDKTAFENVAFAMEAAGKNNKEIKETVPYVLDIVGLSDRMSAFPKQLSGGEQQRVAIARAIANNPKILIADEPTGNLDPASSWDIVQILTKVNNWGTTVIMSTHGTDIVNALNKRVVQMDKGKVIRDDNKGQYELNSNFENRMQSEKSKDTDFSEKKEKRKFKLTLENNSESNKNTAVKRAKINLFGFLKRKKEVKREDIKNVLAEELAPTSFRLKKLHEYLEDDTNEDLTAETNALNKPVKKKKKPAEPKNSELKSVLDTEISKLNLSKEVKKKLKKIGFTNTKAIIEKGIVGLSESMAFTPEEIMQIAEEIKKLTD